MIDLSDILKKENIIKVDPEEHLSKALSRLRTSHDAAFVFDQSDKFYGIINPYYCLIKSSHPGNTKVLHSLYHPPKVYVDYSLAKVAELFIESKIHYLPVFNKEEEFLGIISARRLLKHMANLNIFNNKISFILKNKNKPLVVIHEYDSVSKAVALFKSTKFSKLIVINKDLKLRGILSYYDLVTFMIAPRSNNKDKRKSNKLHYLNHQVNKFVKSTVLTLSPDHNLSLVIKMILDKKIGSVIITDIEKHPIGIITTKDIFNCYIKNQENKFVIPNPIKKIFKKK